MVDVTTVLPEIWVDDGDMPGDVIDALALREFAAGRQPYARSVDLERVKEDAALVPAGATIARSADDDGRRSILAVGQGWTLRSIRRRGRIAEVLVTAVTDELAGTVLAVAIDGATDPVPPTPDVVKIGFWHQTSDGPRLRRRRISTRPWQDIRRNYGAAAARAMEGIARTGPDDLFGRIILLHGPPGTGKTTALRTLAYEWRSWCQVDCVLDPERLLTDIGYLMTVAVGLDDDDGGKDRYRLLILEDCDELVRGDAKHASGQSMSRLLNLTDGLVGQGNDVLVAITTNEDLTRLHPAIVRPGRCLATVEVGALSRDEAVAWLGQADGVRADGATLAELYALRAGRATTGSSNGAVGFYL